MTRHILMVTISVGITVLAVVTYKEAGGFVGGVLFVIGLMNVLLRRKIGQGVYSSSRFFPARLAVMWRDVRGNENLYLGIGIAMVVVGAIDWIVFFFSLVPHDQPIAWFGSRLLRDVR